MDGWLAIEQILPLFAFEFIDMGIYSVDISIFIDQVIDILGLMGDTADNVPGCSGIGPKSAAAPV